MTPIQPSLTHLQQLSTQIRMLRDDALALEVSRAADLEQINPAWRLSAQNLVHYLAVRRHDLRNLQRDLAHLGLSSLGRMEAHVLPTLNGVLVALHRLSGMIPPPDLELNLDMDAGDRLLSLHAVTILGPHPAHRSVRIMVTMPSEAATDPEIIKRALERGMDVMRINCAHDDASAWTKMVAHLRAASSVLKRECRIEFDLAGPKLRTGAITPGPEVMKIKPQRDALGRVTVPAQVFLSTDALNAPAGSVLVPLEMAVSTNARVGDKLHLTDARGRKRRLKLVEHHTTPGQIGWLCTCERTMYLISGTALKLHRGKKASGKVSSEVRVARLPAQPQAIPLSIGDRLILTRDATPGELASASQPAHIACTLPQVFNAAKRGHRILLDDGKIAGVIREANTDTLELEIIQAPGGNVKLRAEKGINLPDTTLELPAMNATDLENLAFIAKHGDIVSLSFVRRRADVQVLVAELNRLNTLTPRTKKLDIVLKIETREAFDNLPELLLSAMQHAPVAVMVARGDLGVEIGFERLAEVQEEMLWLCEAAHAPVIWATQVLESLAQSGLPTRAEVTDAAMAGRAECVMLNKGPYIDATISFLDDVLRRMQDHQDKKTAMLRKLSVSGNPEPISSATNLEHSIKTDQSGGNLLGERKEDEFEIEVGTTR
jgi:pyruvate kinase